MVVGDTVQYLSLEREREWEQKNLDGQIGMKQIEKIEKKCTKKEIIGWVKRKDKDGNRRRVEESKEAKKE